jgi:tRNA pseudouridine55 synthase
MGRRRKHGRSVHGILLLDKPTGITSNAALQSVRRLFGATRAGHTGSLDPMATGLLPICLGEATKISAFLLDADKRYRFTVRLGVTTDSGDADGEVIDEREIGEIPQHAVESALEAFRGDIEQVPPMHSAVKLDGQPLYRLAHKGQTVERKARATTIHRLDLIAFDGRDLELEVKCSKGTYVRTLATELGAMLGPGGHVITLRRTGAGPFTDSDLVELDALHREAEGGGPSALDHHLLPVDAGLQDWPAVTMHPDIADFVRQGQAVQVPGAPASGSVRLYDRERGFFAIGRIREDGLVGPRRLLHLA